MNRPPRRKPSILMTPEDYYTRHERRGGLSAADLVFGIAVVVVVSLLVAIARLLFA